MAQSVKLPREIWVLVAAAVAVSLGYGIVAPVLPQFAKSFDVSTTAATIVVSAFALMRLVFAPASGSLSGRFGERRMYLIGITLVALSSFASGLAQDYWQLLIFRGLGGIGSVTFTVAAMSLIIKWAPPNARGRASAAYGGGFLIGNIAGPAIGSLIAPLGYRWPFFIYAAFLMLAVVIVAWLIPAKGSRHADRLAEKQAQETHVQRPLNPTAPAPEVDDVDRSTMTIAEALAVPRFRLILATAFAQGWTNLGVRVALVPLLAVAIAGEDTWVSGGALTAFAIGNGIALANSGRLSDIRGRRPVIIIGLLVSGLATLGLGLSTNIWFLVATSLIAGFGSGFVQPAQQGAVADIVGNRQGSKVISFFQQAGDLGQILGPVIAGLIVDHAGFGWAFGVSGAILLLAALAWIFSARGTATPAQPRK